jgi:hypothetical protein
MSDSLVQPLEGLPNIADLQGVLSTSIGRSAVKLPLDDGTLRAITVSNPGLDFTTIAKPPSARLYHLVSTAVLGRFEFHGEQFVAQAMDRLFSDVVILLDNLVPPMKKLGLRRFRDAGDGDSLATLLSTRGQPLRPDLQLRATDGVSLVYKGEEKTAGFGLGDAVKDLQPKTKARAVLALHMRCSAQCTQSALKQRCSSTMRPFVHHNTTTSSLNVHSLFHPSAI